MSHFYGVLNGARGEATRCGNKTSGMHTTAASWHGAIKVELFYDGREGTDRYRIIETPWRGCGKYRLIAEGTIGEQP